MHPEDIRAVFHPGKPLEHTSSLVGQAMEAEPRLDIELAKLLLGQGSHRAPDQPTALRILEVLDRVSAGTRLARMISPLLRHADPQIRTKAAKVIARRMENFDWIRAQLLKAEPRVRANMIEALWENGDPECVEVFRLYRDDCDNRVAGNALYGLYVCGEAEAIASVLRMASHPDPRFRATAAWLMSRIDEPKFANVLKTMVRDESRSVKGSALKSLVRLSRTAGIAQDPSHSKPAGTGPAEPGSIASDNYFVSWRPEYSVHIDAIDRQHQALVALIRQLQQAMWEGRGRAFLDTLVDRLVQYANGHFRYEENMLREQGYESLAGHIEQPRILTRQVLELQHRIQTGEAVSGASVMAFLRNWLTEHIMQHDQEYAAALRIT